MRGGFTSKIIDEVSNAVQQQPGPCLHTAAGTRLFPDTPPRLLYLPPLYGLPQKPTVPQEGMKEKSGSMDVDRRAFPESVHHTKLVAHKGIGKFVRCSYSQHHLAKHSLTTSGPEVHKSKSNEDPAYNPPDGVGEMKMCKR